MKNLLTVTLLFILQFSFAQEGTNEIDNMLNVLYQKGRINGNVLIAQNGKIIYNKSFGYANVSTKEKLNENSIFDIASVAKQFTAAAIMILKEDGKLKLDDPIAKHLPELYFYEGVTIKHLLHHTGGLPDYMKLFEANYHEDKIVTNDDIIEYFSNEKPNKLFEAGEDWRYSNTGYTLLASVIERVSGLNYSDYLSNTIFKPLKMNNTFVNQSKSKPLITKNLALSYAYSDSLNTLVNTDNLKEYNYVKMFSGVVGDGGVFSTVIDLIKWDRALYTDKVISEKGKKEMFTPVLLADGSTFDYGYGWQLDTNEIFGNTVLHTGGWGGYLSLFERHIDNDKTIIILFNHKGSEVVNKKVRYGLYGLPEPNPTNKTEITLTEAQLNRVVGVYEIKEGREFLITLKDGDTYASMTHQTPLRIYAESETSFFFKEFNASILFEKDETGTIKKLTFIQGEHKMEAIKRLDE